MLKISPSRIFLACLLSFLCGIYFASLLPFNLSSFLFVITALAVFLLIFYKELILKISALSLISLLIGISYFHISNTAFEKNNIKIFVNKNIVFSGVIVGEIKKSDKYQEIILGNLRVAEKFYKGRVLIFAQLYPTYKIGDYLEVKGTLGDPPKFSDFDYKSYLRKEGIFGLIVAPDNLRKIPSLPLKKSTIFFLKSKADLLEIKTAFIKKINKILAEPYGAFLAGLLVGAREEIPEGLLTKFNHTGITHTIAISGYNISIIIAALLLMGRSIPKKILYPILTVCVIGFVVLVGGQASVVRAAIMAGIVVVALGFGRKADALIALATAAVGMALINPYVLRFDAGFQLSFLATLGLVIFSEKFENIKLFKKIPGLFRDALVATLSATILVLPVLAFDFGRISLVSPLVNMLILPAVPVAMLLGFIAGIFGFLCLGAGEIIGWAALIFLYYIIWVVELFSRLPFASIEIEKFSWIWIVLYYIVVYLLWRFWLKDLKKNTP